MFSASDPVTTPADRHNRSLVAQGAGLPEHIIRILPLAEATVEGKLGEMQRRFKAIEPELKRMLADVQRPGLSKKARVSKLRALASRVSESLASLSACQNQTCSHCCHIPVALTGTEAALIGEAVGRKPRKVSAKVQLSQEFGYHRPCPFLKNDRCSIYAHRPFVCRTHMSLDESDRLCRLVPEVTVPVPLVDMTQFHSLYVELTVGEPLADIRDFFG